MDNDCKICTIVKRLIDAGIKNFTLHNVVVQDGRIVKVEISVGDKTQVVTI